MGLGFKAALAPFHFWTPDVYQGSPTPVVLFMATSVKAAAFAALLRVAAPPEALALLVALSVVVGNLAALAQKEAKRLLAYSSPSTPETPRPWASTSSPTSWPRASPSPS